MTQFKRAKLCYVEMSGKFESTKKAKTGNSKEIYIFKEKNMKRIKIKA
jgi:hypothetical protein